VVLPPGNETQQTANIVYKEILGGLQGYVLMMTTVEIDTNQCYFQDVNLLYIYWYCYLYLCFFFICIYGVDEIY
jgi:hypothetical protein